MIRNFLHFLAVIIAISDDVCECNVYTNFLFAKCMHIA